jgi:hypothetical protein
MSCAMSNCLVFNQGADTTSRCSWSEPNSMSPSNWLVDKIVPKRDHQGAGVTACTQNEECHVPGVIRSPRER